MSKWFIEHRQQFIADHLRVFGQINRAALAQRFDISPQQASTDLGLFMKERPEVLTYDGKAKCYVVDVEALPADAGMVSA